jgi:hypothetical protein
MDNERLKEEIAPPEKWTEPFTRVLHALIDSMGKSVSGEHLSRIWGQDFTPRTMNSINAFLRVRGLKYQVCIVEGNPERDTFEKIEYEIIETEISPSHTGTPCS